MAFNDDLVAVLPRLRRFARGLTGNVTEADDLVQTACARALARAHQFREGTRFDSWMFRIVQTIWIDQMRSKGNHIDVPLGAVEDELGSSAPTTLAEARLLLGKTRMAINELPSEQRAVIELVAIEGLSYKEAAAVAGIPIGTVQSRLSRARAALVARFGESLAA